MKRILCLAVIMLLGTQQLLATDYSILSAMPEPLATPPQPLSSPEYSTLHDSVDLDGRPERLLYFTADWCIVCKTQVAPELKTLREAGWKIGGDPEGHIQVIDVDFQPDWQRRFKITELPVFVMISGEREVRRHVGAADRFKISEIYKGKTCQPTRAYPSRGGWWTVLGDPTPSRAYLLGHMIEHPNHSGKFNTSWLEKQSYESLMSLHSDDHERAVKWDYVQGPDQKREVSSSRYREFQPEKSKKRGLLSRVFGKS